MGEMERNIGNGGIGVQYSSNDGTTGDQEKAVSDQTQKEFQISLLVYNLFCRIREAPGFLLTLLKKNIVC